MLKRILGGIVTSVVVATTVLYAQTPPPQGAAQDPAGRGAAPGGRAGGGGRGGGNYPTEEQWTNMPPSAKAFVDKATELAGTDPDLQFDKSIFCRADGGASNTARATLGVPNGEPKLTVYGAPSPKQFINGQRFFDNMYYIGDTGVGAFIFTSTDGYILWDALNNEQEAREVLVPGMQKLGLDPAKIKYVIYGHYHGDHTGGGEYLQRMYHPKMVMHREDWEQYAKMGQGGGRGRGADPAGAATAGAGANAAGAAPAPGGRGAAGGGGRGGGPPMTHDMEALDGQVIQLGDLKLTIFEMTGHTPGSIGGVINVKWQGRDHPLLIVTAGSDIPNINSLVGGYEHIWDAGIKAGAESVMQVHPNTNMNILARMKYVDENYKTLKTHPMLYGAARTVRYLNIVRNCTLARMEILGW